MYNRYEEDFVNDMFYAQWQAQEIFSKARNSYPEGAEYAFCPYCGELLIYESISYHEGFHIECVY